MVGMNTHLSSRRRFLFASSALAGSLIFQRHLFGQDQAGRPLGRVKKDLFVHPGEPLNAEPELAQLVKSRITPLEQFYVRNHGPIPQVKANEVRLTVDGLVHKKLELGVEELQGKHKRHSAEATLTCAGNRRAEMSQIKEISGVQWQEGAIGNAQWQGIALADVLKQAELREGAKHVWFEGLDPIKEKDGSVAPFGGSIPLEKALASKDGELSLIAFQMNGQPLLPEHGFPMRTVVPGYIGARSVKWLTKITVSDRPSPNHYVADAYKIIQTVEEAKEREPIYPFVINSIICTVENGGKLKAGKQTIAGYALPTGEPGCTIESVEISTDGGKSWQEAKLEGGEQASKPYTWALWTADVDLSPGKHQLVVRATDTKGNHQPEKGAWNLKGYLFNGWQRVNVEVA